MNCQSQLYCDLDPKLVTRRWFFQQCGLGLGGIALASLLSERKLFGATPGPFANPVAPRPPHFKPRAKNVIYLFMAGGPSQLELFDYKPKLIELNGQPIPQSFIEGKRFAFMGSSHGTKLLGPRGGAVNWGSGFLPTSYQGVPLRGSGDPILDLSNPAGVSTARQRQTIDAIRDLNLNRAVETGDPEINTRIAAYEMAYRMQTSAPELIDLSGESKATLDLYGVEPGKPSFARNCLLARRLVERGVRFVQLYHTNWDSHGGPGENLQGDFEKVCRDVDQAQSALVKDLKVRGLLADTLVVWGGEFGRTPMGENRDTTGRNHHIDAFTMWFAGGGVKAGCTLGQTDELGFNPVEDRCHVHDIHATILHLLGLEHTRLTFRFQGRDFRLTDVSGDVIHK